MRYTEEIDKVSKELGVNEGVAMDIIYLRKLEVRLISLAKKFPHLGGFEFIFNDLLEEELKELEEQIIKIIKNNSDRDIYL